MTAARLAGRVVLVTGGSRGLGAAIAEDAAAEGATVLVGFHRREREAAAVVSAVVAAGGRAEPMQIDVRDTASVEAAVARALAAHRRIDGLVTSAGVVSDGWLAAMSDPAWDDVVETNLGGTMRAVRAVLRPMMREKKGAIVAVASVVGLRGQAGQPNYAASKAGVVALVRSAALEVGRHGIRVNALAPGLFDAGMVKATAPAHIEKILPNIPLGRLGRPAELARAATFLLSDDASYVTGETLVVDGGLLA